MARLAGVLYLAIILLGLTSELALRGALLVPGDAAATAERILAAPGLLREWAAWALRAPRPATEHGAYADALRPLVAPGLEQRPPRRPTSWCF